MMSIKSPEYAAKISGKYNGYIAKLNDAMNAVKGVPSMSHTVDEMAKQITLYQDKLRKIQAYAQNFASVNNSMADNVMGLRSQLKDGEYVKATRDLYDGNFLVEMFPVSYAQMSRPIEQIKRSPGETVYMLNDDGHYPTVGNMRNLIDAASQMPEFTMKELMSCKNLGVKGDVLTRAVNELIRCGIIVPIEVHKATGPEISAAYTAPAQASTNTEIHQGNDGDDTLLFDGSGVLIGRARNVSAEMRQQVNAEYARERRGR
ncbi:MAG: hypothetical protein HY364_02750 [Candidatus Aenigmarchaeota archaeon]|nr:hypothetical protein [Candidatus Aenigmarchaeota archaeon]